jgi:hypothetical protein
MIVDLAVALSHVVDKVGGHAEMVAHTAAIAALCFACFAQLVLELTQPSRARTESSAEKKSDNNAC